MDVATFSQCYLFTSKIVTFLATSSSFQLFHFLLSCNDKSLTNCRKHYKDEKFSADLKKIRQWSQSYDRELQRQRF
jgi:hypothetical protein